MKCPYCTKDIPDQEIAKYLASKGGRKSRRTLSTEDSLKMTEARERKKRVREEMKDLEKPLARHRTNSR